jgi:hypothetical protein
MARNTELPAASVPQSNTPSRPQITPRSFIAAEMDCSTVARNNVSSHGTTSSAGRVSPKKLTTSLPELEGIVNRGSTTRNGTEETFEARSRFDVSYRVCPGSSGVELGDNVSFCPLSRKPLLTCLLLT